MELHSSGTSVTFDPVSIEGEWVAQLVAKGEGEVEVALLSKAVQHVEHCTASRLVGLEEHYMGMGLTRAQRGSLSIRRREDGAGSRLDAAGGQVKGSERFNFQKKYCQYCLPVTIPLHLLHVLPNFRKQPRGSTGTTSNHFKIKESNWMFFHLVFANDENMTSNKKNDQQVLPSFCRYLIAFLYFRFQVFFLYCCISSCCNKQISPLWDKWSQS